MSMSLKERGFSAHYFDIRQAGSFEKYTGIFGPEFGRVWCPGDRIFVDICEYFDLSVSKVYLF